MTMLQYVLQSKMSTFRPDATKPAMVVFHPCSANRPNPGKCFTKSRVHLPYSNAQGQERQYFQSLADFKEILGDHVPLWCLSPVTAKVTRVTLTVVLFMLLDFLLLKLFGSLLFAPHLLTTNTRIKW